jgi:capsular polysaccharide biosynthesis protein
MTAARTLTLPLQRWPARPATIARARVIGRDWTVYQPGRAFWSPTIRRRVASAAAGEQVTLTATPPALRMAGRAILLGGFPVYYHALIDFALNIAALRGVPGGDSLPLLVDDDPPRFMARIAPLLGVDPARLVPLRAGAVALCEALVLLPHAVGAQGQFHRAGPAVAWLRAAAARAWDGHGAALPRRILVSRARAAMRRIANHEEVRAACAARGFVEVALEDLPIARQWRLFAGAEAVVAAHGSGLANIAFMAPGALLVECVPGRGRCPPMFTHLAAGLGLRHVVLPQDAPQNAPDFAVDAAGVAAALDAALG